MNKVGFIISILLINSTIYGTEIFGTIKKIQGIAFANERNLIINDNIFVNDDITTKENSKVMILQKNGNVISIGKNSHMKLIKYDEVAVKKGYNFFHIINKSMQNLNKEKFKIRLKSASIGIRGTNFLVNSNKIESIILRKGKLNIVANKGKFKVFKAKDKILFDDFKQKALAEQNKFMNGMNDEFAAYKQKEKFDFLNFKKAIQLKSNTMLSFGQNNEVYSNKVSKDQIKAKFNEFDKFISNK